MDKDKLRIEIKARIASLDRVYIEESNYAIFQNVILLPEFLSARRVFTYLSIGHEADTINIIEHCSKTGKTVALPTDYENGRMNFALLDLPTQELQRGIYNIPVPAENAERLVPESGDIIIVPALCYDESGYRLGRGGGYYDRYLSSCAAFSVGLCREKLLIDRVPRNDFDIRVDCLVTEKRIARPE